MKIVISTLICILMTYDCIASDVIPPHIVGIWANEDSKFEGVILHEGQGLYIGSDGVGAYVEGPPAMGFKINATYNSKSNIIEFDLMEGGVIFQHVSMIYDDVSETIRADITKNKPLKRRFDEFSETTKKALGF